MIISKLSWGYRFLKKRGYSINNITSCKYKSLILLESLKFLAVYYTLITFFLLMLITISGHFFDFREYINEESNIWIKLSILPSLGLVAALVTALVTALVLFCFVCITNIFKLNKEKNKCSRLIKTWIMEKKDKYCPMITFVDPNDDNNK